RLRACIKAELDARFPTSPTSRAQLLEILRIADPHSINAVRDSWSDDDVKLETERAAFQANLRFPTMRSDVELANVFWRKHADASTITGTSRMMRGMRQDRINSLLQGKKL